MKANDCVRIHFLLFFLILLVYSLIASTANAQVRAGSAYLKIMPGTRQQSLANSLTGGLDATYSFYANPAATGLLREWQWSASYTNWIADISNFSFVYGRQFRLITPWSNKISLALGANYQGVGEFDATRGAQPKASASDFLLTTSFGFPITTVSRDLSFGANIKYLRTELGPHNASTVIFDFGFLYRSPRIILSDSGRGLFEYAIISAGISINQLGQAMQFLSEKTPLPRTFRAGIGLNFGKHDGLQIQLVGDYRDVRDEVGRFSFGTEIINLFGPLSRNLGRMVSLRGGYDFNSRQRDDFVSRFSLGLSVHLDDYMYGSPKGLTPRNTELRFDLGVLKSDKFSNISQGSATYRPIRPEHFEFVESKHQSFLIDNPPLDPIDLGSDRVTLSWEASQDPDLYDNVNYLLFLSKERASSLLPYVKTAKLNQMDDLTLRDYDDDIDKIDSSEVKLVYLSSKTDTSNRNAPDESRLDRVVYDTKSFHQETRLINYVLPTLPTPADTGDFYWTVIAYDRNKHMRVIDKAGSQFARFYVKPKPLPELEITFFEPTGEEIGRARQVIRAAEITVKNNSTTMIESSFDVTTEVYDLEGFDSIVFDPVEETEVLAAVGLDVRKSSKPPLKINWDLSPQGRFMTRVTIDSLAAGDSITFKVPWSTDYPDYPYMIARVDPENRIPESNEDNNMAIDDLFLFDLEIKKTADVPPLRPEVRFALGAHRLDSASKKRLEVIRQALMSEELRDKFVKIEGHTDLTGFKKNRKLPAAERERADKEDNQRLSKRRATSVGNFLMRSHEHESAQIDSSRFYTVGHGLTKPRQDLPLGVSKTMRDSLNRRVEITLLKQKVMPGKQGHEDHNETIDVVATGAEFRYDLAIKNKGPFTARNFQVWDALPPYLALTKVDSLDSFETRNDTLFWNIASLAAGDSINIAFTVRLDSIPNDSIVYELTNTTQIATPHDMESKNNISTKAEVYAIKSWTNR